MRYHSILFQTLLNGNNAIIDYTLPKEGKIISFLEQFDLFDYYKFFYISLYEENFDLRLFSDNVKYLSQKKTYTYNKNIFEDTIQKYSSHLIKLFN